MTGLEGHRDNASKVFVEPIEEITPEVVAPLAEEVSTVGPLEFSATEGLTTPRLEDIKPGRVLLDVWLRLTRIGPEGPLEVIIDHAIPTLIISDQEIKSVYGDQPAVTVKAITATGSTRYFNDIDSRVMPAQKDEPFEGYTWCILADNSPENRDIITSRDDERGGIPALRGGYTQEAILANFLRQLSEDMQNYLNQFSDNPEVLISKINSID